MRLLRANFKKNLSVDQRDQSLDAVLFGWGRQIFPTCGAASVGVLGGGGGVALERILFVLPKIGSKLELSLMRLLRVGKISQWTKKIKDAVGFLVGQADFSKIAQRKQKFIKHVNCVFT